MINATSRDGIAVLSIDMPGRSMNVLTPELAERLGQAFDAAVADPAVRGIVIASGKPSFVAGADLGQMPELGKAAPERALAGIAVYGDLFRRIETAGKPVVGAASGTALGGGLELLLATHYRIAADAPSARFGLPEVTLGLLPAAGGTQRLPRMVGIDASLPLLTEGRSLDPEAALQAGLLDAVVPAERLLDAACEALRAGRVDPIAPWDRQGFVLPGGDADETDNAQALAAAEGRLVARTRGLQPAPIAILRAVREGSRLAIDPALARERELFVPLVRGRTAQNMIRTLFFARQAADKLSQRPASVPPGKVGAVGVIGAGFMGAGVAQVSALAGIDVVLLDRSPQIARDSVDGIARAMQAEVDKGRLSAQARADALARLRAGDDYAALADCDLVIEAVVEDEAVKAKVIAATEAATGPRTIFASNTSALPIDALAASGTRPDRFVGLHFFSPVPRMALVEVIAGAATSDETLARALDYVRQIRKTPIVVRDGYGFYTTRCVDAYYREGIRLLLDGVEPAQVEAAGIALGMPVGPLALCDEIGLDVLQHIARFFQGREQGAMAQDRHLRVNAAIDALVAAGRAGRKRGAGFYAYPQGAAKRLDADFIGRLPGLSGDGARLDAAAVGERLLYAQLLEAARCWAAGIVRNPDEIDLGAHLGWGFPSHLGGPAAAIDDIGPGAFVQRLDRLCEAAGPRFQPPAELREAVAGGFRFRP